MFELPAPPRRLLFTLRSESVEDEVEDDDEPLELEELERDPDPEVVLEELLSDELIINKTLLFC